MGEFQMALFFDNGGAIKLRFFFAEKQVDARLHGSFFQGFPLQADYLQQDRHK